MKPPKDSKKDAIEDKSGAIKYAKSLQLSFVDDPILASKVNGKILQVESDGKLVIPRNALSANQFDDTSLKISQQIILQIQNMSISQRLTI